MSKLIIFAAMIIIYTNIIQTADSSLADREQLTKQLREMGINYTADTSIEIMQALIIKQSHIEHLQDFMRPIDHQKLTLLSFDQIRTIYQETFQIEKSALKTNSFSQATEDQIRGLISRKLEEFQQSNK